MTLELRPPELLNLEPATDHDLGRAHLSHSAIGTLLSCQQKFHHHYERRLDPAVTAEPLAIGKAFAHALETSNPSSGAALLRQQAQLEADRAAGNPWVVVPSKEDVDKQATIVGYAARAYLNKYGSRGQTRELELRVRLRNPEKGGRYSTTHDLVVRVDAVADDHSALFEDKLVGQIPRKDLAARVRLDRQVTIEAYALWRVFGVNVDQIHYRMTLKPSIEQRTKRQPETWAEYLQRIGTEYETRPDHYLVEEIAQRTDDDFLRLEQELWDWAGQIRDARRKGVWPRSTGACHEYGGCRFLPLCAREPGAEHQYVTRLERDTVVSLPTAPSVSGEDERRQEAA